ncbi:MAG: YciI family protein [Chitinophagaceae bacterium]
MKEFLLLFRGDYKTKASPDEMQTYLQQWINWIAGIEEQNKLADRGNALESSGKLLKSGGLISEGPYTETKESIMSYTLIIAASIEEAATLCQECPFLSNGDSVEIREIVKL